MSDTKARQTLNVDLGELKPLVEAAAKNQGKRPGAWVRDAVALALQEHEALPARVPLAAPNRRPGAEVVHFGGRLTAEQSRALAAKAAAEGCSQIELVARFADGTLVPQRFQTIDALADLNRGLQTLDANLRAMAAHVQSPEVQAALQSTARVVRAQMRRAAEVLGQVSATRRSAARRP